MSADTGGGWVEVPCNLCGADDFSVRFHSPAPAGGAVDPADFVASTDRFGRYGRIVACRCCGLVYANPRPPKDRIEDAYGRAADPDYQREDSSRSINAHFSLSTIKTFASGGRLLDVGCATGYFLNACRMDFECRGLEPSRWAAEYARDKLKLDVRAARLEQADFPDGSFDVVCLIDVLEHLTDPQSAVQTAARLTRDGGYLYLVTPDVGSLSARLLAGRWWGLRPAHLHYFSRSTVERLLARNGYRILLARSFGKIFTLSYWASRLKSYPRWLHAPLAGAIRGLGLDDKFFYLNTRDSLEVVAQKAHPR